MNIADEKVEKIIVEIKNYLNNFHVSFKTITPYVLEERLNSYSSKTFSLIINYFFFDIYNLFQPIHKKKYIFLNLRFKEIINLFNKNDLLILSRLSEIKYTKNKGYSSYLISSLHYSLEHFIATNNSFFLKKNIKRFYKRITNKIANNKIIKYIFIWADQDLSGLIISSMFSDNNNIKVIHIAHGYPLTTSNNQYYQIDGSNCKYNFIWSDQSKDSFYNKEKRKMFNLGLPYEVKIPKKKSNKIILVGHGDHKSIVYKKTIEHYKKIALIFKNEEYQLEYRPHPYEINNEIEKYFNTINTEEKQNLLQDSFKIFMGFSSTLLFEAKSHNHIVIELDTSIINYYIDYEYTKKFLENEYINIPTYLRNYDHNYFINVKNEKLEYRFNKILNIIENE